MSSIESIIQLASIQGGGPYNAYPNKDGCLWVLTKDARVALVVEAILYKYGDYNPLKDKYPKGTEDLIVVLTNDQVNEIIKTENANLIPNELVVNGKAIAVRRSDAKEWLMKNTAAILSR